MSGDRPRIIREKKTVELMIRLFCKRHHNTKIELCTDCQELSDYANKRLDKCTFQENKPTCPKCKIHCYSPSMREKIRTVMRYSGPRMLLRHPVLAVYHIIDGRKRVVDLTMETKK